MLPVLTNPERASSYKNILTFLKYFTPWNVFINQRFNLSRKIELTTSLTLSDFPGTDGCLVGTYIGRAGDPDLLSDIREQQQWEREICLNISLQVGNITVDCMVPRFDFSFLPDYDQDKKPVFKWVAVELLW